MASLQKRPGPRYRVQVRLQGVYRSATFPTVALARRWATQTEHALYAQGHFAQATAAHYRLDELLTRYAREVLPRKRPGTQVHQAQQLGPLRRDQLTPARRRSPERGCSAGTTSAGAGGLGGAALSPPPAAPTPDCWG